MNWNIDKDNRKQLKSQVIEDILLHRRVMLRGALAVGCSLFVPLALFSSPATSANSAAPKATKKVPKTSVQYQTQPKGDQKCGNCVNFIAGSNTCKLVDGQISPNGWCSLWTKKA